MPLQLEGVGLRNQLVNARSLTNMIMRHYTWEVLKEIRKARGNACLFCRFQGLGLHARPIPG